MAAPEVTKATRSYTAQQITFSSSKPVKEVLASLDLEVNRKGSGLEMLKLLSTVESKKELDEGMSRMTEGSRDFVLFVAGSHSRWLNAYFEGERTFPETHVYTIGNPLIAQTILQHDAGAGLHIPPKIMIQEIEGGVGTRIVYDSASSTVVMVENDELKKAADALDNKLERLVRKVLSYNKL